MGRDNIHWLRITQEEVCSIRKFSSVSTATSVKTRTLKPTWKKELQKTWPLYVLCIPAFIFVCIFSYGPMVGLLMAFQDYKPWLGISGSRWIGLANFERIFQYDEATQAIVNTLIIAVSKIIVGIIVPIVMAILLSELRNIGVKKSVQTLVYLPHFLSWVTVAGLMIDILGLEGGVNRILTALFGIQPVYFLGNPDLFRYTVVISDVWKSFGFGMIVYLATIAGINPSYYEAAEIDGATRRQQIRFITLPSMLPMIIVISTLSLGSILDAGFDQIFNLYNPLVYSTGDIIDTYVYRSSLLNGQYGFGTAVGLFKSGISLVLIVVSYRLAYKYANYKIF
ncbi:sugar ABC transporter permease [Paenibacillus barcinonensis]|uniref:Putative aldouronate transport system permease protein n=1 Tax=Paenibacillus barcinonensis TaxID=198119 RepID=A0A2V4UYZ1_PAEBA|nr:putative aldouronate transport system permease protein [Paenibacillus barcinonensis]QKS55262.1 sugar ABC transporter permease [Paenibacillus barcinonensis]